MTAHTDVFVNTRLLETVVSLVDRVLVDFDIVELLTDLTRSSTEILGKQTGLLVADPDSDLHLMAASSAQPGAVELFRLAAQEGPCRDCYTSGSVIGVDDVRAATDRWPRFVAAAGEFGFSSMHAVPIRGGETVLGTLGLVSDDGGMDDADVLMAQALARIAGMALLRQRGPDSSTAAPRLNSALAGQHAVERAKGFLRGTLDVTPDEAFTLLRTYSREHGEYLTDLARRLVTDRLVRPAMMAEFAAMLGRNR
ncbi:hypothetical protein BST22_16460 [Mycolicibacterium chubuense]|nr:hypothetical protein BST22_16460 [Mycolicibacterium chubuense]